MNITEAIQLADSDLYEYLKSLSHADKRSVWNEISRSNPDRIRSLTDYLKDIVVTKTKTRGAHKGEEYSISAFKEITASIRDDAIIEAWDNERELIKQGKGTVNWTAAEQKKILDTPPGQKVSFGRGNKNYQGHHMCNAATYPEFAGEAKNIQFLKGYAQSKGTQHNLAHNGDSSNVTNYFFDTITGKKIDFDTSSISHIQAPELKLTELQVGTNTVKGIPNPELSAYEDIFPGFSQLEPDEKVVIQRLESAWKQSGDAGDFSDFIVKHCPDVPTPSGLEGSYLDELASLAVAKLDLSAIDGIPTKYADMIKFGNFDRATRLELTNLAYKLNIEKIDPSTIDMESIIKNCKGSDILEDCKIMQADDFLEYVFKKVDLKHAVTAPGLLKRSSNVKASPAFSFVRNSGIEVWLEKQTINVIGSIRKNPAVEKLVAKGLGKRIVNEALDAPDLIEFAVLCVDIYKGVSSGTMTIDEAGKKVFDWGIVVLGSEAGAAIGAAIVPPIGPIVGGILGGTLAAIFGEFFYDDLVAGAFNFWDSVLSDGRQHLLEGASGNDIFNFAHGNFTNHSIREIFCHPDETDITFDIESKGGNDYVSGYQNDDTLVGGDGNDILIGSGGNDTIYGDGRTSDYKAASEDLADYYRDVIYGGSGNDMIYGGTGNDVIYGDGIKSQSEVTPNDIFMMPKLSFDEKWQEPLFDVFNPYNELDTTYNDTIYGEDGTDFIMGGQGNDVIYGGNDDDVIYGEGDNDKIFGEDGNDYIDGGEGNNSMLEGGKGDDYIVSGSGDDTIYGDKEGGTSDIHYGNDTIIVEGGRNYIVGGSYDDYIVGGSGNDTIYGDNDNGYSDYRDGDDVLLGGEGNDTIYTGDGDDYVDAGDGNDRINGEAGDNEIHAGSGYDIVYGGDGVETVYGGDGGDSIHGGYNNDVLYGEDGNDTLYGDESSDELYGGTGNDSLIGGDGYDYLSGGEGNDDLIGGAGRDILDGGEGNDYLSGGESNDSYFFGYGYGNDTMHDQYGISHVELGEIDIEDVYYETAENGHDFILSFDSSPEDTLTILDFDKQRENIYFWAYDESYQVNEDGKLVPKAPPKDPSGSGSGSGGSLPGDIRDNTIPIIGKRYDDAGKAQPPRDPLIIDLNGDGVKTTTVENGVHFDIDNNGFAEKTAWIDTIDGFLVYNRDEDKSITNGSELFSDQVIFPDGTRSADGFDVLKRFDTNGDKVVDSSDNEFGALQVWIDKNHDGNTYFPVSDEEEELLKKELFTLAELGITSIGTVPQSPEGEEEDSPNKELFAHVMINGDEHTISEHWFEAITSDTQELHTEGIDDDLTSFGNLHSISYALDPEHDTDGYLNSLYDRFKVSDDYAEKRILVKKILYRISGAENIKMNSRGNSIDARELHVIETIMGVEHFIGAGNSINPNSNAAVILKEVYNKFETLYFVLLNDNTKSSTYLDLIEERYNENNEKILNVEFIKQLIDDRIENNEVTDEMLCSVGMFLKAYDNANSTNYFKTFKQEYSAQNEYFAKMADANFVLGTDNGESINGSYTNDVFYVEGGNDTVYASNGDDVIYGGDGSDTLNAGSGNDIAYGSSGDDTINGDAGNDVMYGEEGNDTLNGGTGDDSLYAGEGDDTLNGGEGDDVLYGAEGNDALDGGEGNDALYGGDGNDTLSGGTGDDILDGGAGDDTYYINAEHGNDTIIDSEGLTTIVFGDEISADSYDLNIDINSGITLVNSETGETIGLPDFINVPENYEFTFDGESKILGGGETRQVIEGTDGDDTITAGDGFNVIRGGEGNDTITGGDNLNFIYGGEGDDTITGGNGTNIIHGDEGNDSITDGSGSSYIDGGEGEDIIHAGEGSDIIIGGAGADKLYGEDGDDVIAGNTGNDEIDGGNGDDTVYADAGNDTVHGGAGNDSLFGGNGYDTLYGDDGDDYLEAGHGEDNLYGGTGNDVLVGGTGVNNMYGDEGDDIFHGGNGINNMYGGDGDDTFTGGELADYIEGGSGNDTMNGGNGENRMFGNDGNDTMNGGNDNDYIEGGDGNDELYGGNGINTIYGGTGSDKIFDGDENSFLYGGDGDDEIRAGGGSDVLDGGAGNDYLQSDHGGDTYIFGEGYDVDTIHASADLNTIVIHGYTADDMHNTRMPNNDLVVDFGTDTGDRLVIEGFFNFNTNRDFNFVFDDETVLGQDQIEAVNAPIYGTSGDDQLFAVDGTGWSIIGSDGKDKLNGSEGNDILDGGTGDDVLNGGTGANTYVYGVGYDIDTIEASADSCTIVIHGYNAADMNSVRETDKSLAISFGAETGDKLIIKSFYEDYLDRNYQFIFDDGTVLGKSDINAKAAPIVGTDESDYLFGTNEDDILDGGAGNDSLAGSNGEDTYIFGKGYAQDSINEWGSDHSFVVLKDISSDEITVSDQWGSNLLISVNDTEDVLTVSNFKWGQATYTFSFADGAEGYVDKNTWELVLTKQPDPVEEEDIEQTGAELLSEIYDDETLASDLLNGSDSTVITDTADIADISGENDDIADITDIQTMVLTENMSAFSNDSQVSDGINISEITADASGLEQLLVSSTVQ